MALTKSGTDRRTDKLKINRMHDKSLDLKVRKPDYHEINFFSKQIVGKFYNKKKVYLNACPKGFKLG